jgi:KUP system potassium uptake protein
MRCGESLAAMQTNAIEPAEDVPRHPSGPTPLRILVLGALGVVFGDIGTSPLYALRSCFTGQHGLGPTHANVLGVLSLIFWSLAIVVSLKYIALVLRADNRGEGGILALMALAFPERERASASWVVRGFTLLGIFGAALLYGDGLITPAVTVLGAIEGLEVATPRLKPYTVPLAVLVLVVLFSVQRKGTGGVGRVFGGVMLTWFIAIAALGLREVCHTPEVIAAVWPGHAVRFLLTNGWHGFHVLGSVFLVLTGAEALYADMGHFGRRPIRLAWLSLVLPALFLNYLGQGALVLRRADAAANPFFGLAPPGLLYPLVGLATSAAIVASQALISGAFSLTMQAVQLGYLPRVAIAHTSSAERGQIYIPGVNWLLMVACIALVVGFKTSDNLAAAYGIAVVLTMLITTCLFFFAARRLWGWSLARTAALGLVFLVVDLGFLGANIKKIPDGGWFPLVVGLAGFTLMSTWKTGRARLRQRLAHSLLPIGDFLDSMLQTPPPRVKGTAVFLAGNPDGTPLALLHNLKHNKTLHERVILLTVLTEEVPHVEDERKVEMTDLHNSFYRVIARYGFMEEPQVPEILARCRVQGLNLREHETTFFLSRESIIASERRGLARWRKHLFALLARNAQPATAYFGLPANRVVELGMQIEI